MKDLIYGSLYVVRSLKKIPFTRAGYEKIKSEYERLRDERPKILERLQKAREMGDLSENGMYKAARLELGDTDRRLRRLTYLMRLGQVVDSHDNNVASFGSRVKLSIKNKEVTYTLVNKHEADPSSGKISVESPLGKAVLGKKVGDDAVLELENRTLVYRVEEIL